MEQHISNHNGHKTDKTTKMEIWDLKNYNNTCSDKGSSALASGAGTARDSLGPFLSWSTRCILPPRALCL